MAPDMRFAVALGRVAALAGRQDVGPDMGATARHRHDMVGGQVFVAKALAAVGTQVAVAPDQLAPRQGRDRVGELARPATASLDRDDRMDVDLRAGTRQPAHAAAKRGKAVPQRPRDGARGVETGSLFDADPALRNATDVNLQDLGQMLASTR